MNIPYHSDGSIDKSKINQDELDRLITPIEPCTQHFREHTITPYLVLPWERDKDGSLIDNIPSVYFLKSELESVYKDTYPATVTDDFILLARMEQTFFDSHFVKEDVARFNAERHPSNDAQALGGWLWYYMVDPLIKLIAGEIKSFKDYIIERDNITPMRYYRVQHGYTVKDIAAVVGYSAPSMYKLENERTLPPVDILDDLEQFYGLERGEMYGLSADELEQNKKSPIRLIREQLDFTLEDVSIATGMSNSYISKIERNQMNPTQRIIDLLSEVYNMDITHCFPDFEGSTENTNNTPRVSIKEERNLAISPNITGEKLKNIRISSGVTLANAAEQAGLSKSHLSRIENGKRLVTDELIQELLDIYSSNH